jgi:hypothetical protein
MKKLTLRNLFFFKQPAKNNLDLFLEVFTEKLADNLMHHPDQYSYGPETIPSVVDRLKEALVKGTPIASNGAAHRETCQALGIDPSPKSVREFVSKK